MMSSKKDSKLSTLYRSVKATSAPSYDKTKKRKRRREECDLPAPEVLARSQGDGAISRADLSEEEQKLRRFDLQSKFGPCAGITRLERWERAQKFGLNPPAEIRNIIMAQGGPGCEADCCLWHDRI
ncbi:hypothetical protein Vretimale_16043 [Volvox reticuliferus]|uniref:DNA polymerase delta subunit 4 n=1 Tax=Volvox reticuliferus TaxID=1737510 RepID=A0A8J4CKS6_9CHLO|nr:hypothetical protein Vretifemale_9717 [Volvox reticuliferus]GIM12810.1 hypothetical protein Vretimale_16043 [Volvox reticuliferus]